MGAGSLHAVGQTDGQVEANAFRNFANTPNNRSEFSYIYIYIYIYTHTHIHVHFLSYLAENTVLLR